MNAKYWPCSFVNGSIAFELRIGLVRPSNVLPLSREPRGNAGFALAFRLARLVGCSGLLARLAASTARASGWYGLDHGAEKTIHGLRRVEDLCNIGLEDDGHGVFAHSRGKAIGAALAEIELVLRSQFVTSAS
jgi:hypothetical protein